MTKRQLIPINGCHFCEKDKWIIERKALNLYRCQKCHRIVDKVLRRKYG